ncbi:LuxR family transcriptional regulator, partial [Streptomyces sp. T21Q-yed]
VLRGAARQTLADGRADKSVQLLRRALREQAPTTREYDLLTELGAAALAAESPEALPHLRQAMEKAPTATTRVATGLHYARALTREHRHPAALALLRELSCSLPSGEERLRTRLDAITALVSLASVGTRADARALVHSRYPARTAGGPEATLLRALRLVVDRDHGATASTLVRQINSMLRITEFAPDGLTGLPAVHLVVCVLACTGRLSEARGLLLDTLPHSTDTRAAEHQSDSVGLQAMLAYGLGELDDAERYARAVLDLRADDRPPGLGVPLAASVLGHVLLERGDREAAGRVLRDSVPSGKPPEQLLFAPLWEARARLCAELGRLDEALDIWRHARWLTSDGRLGLRVTGAWHHVALALIVAGREDEARAMIRRETESAQELGAPVPLALVHRVDGALGGGSHGLEELQRAVALLSPSEQPLQLAAALVQLGSVQRRSRQRAAARRSLTQGREIARECGARALVELAEAEMRVLGARPVRGGINRLTPSEQRVAELARAGVPNREIARGLFVSVKTVEWHLSHVYRKLGVRSRHELPSVLPQETDAPAPASAHQRPPEPPHRQQDAERRDSGTRGQGAP